MIDTCGIQDAVSKSMGMHLKADWLETPVGPMVAIADEEALYLLEFHNRCGLEKEIEQLRSKLKGAIPVGRTKITHSIERELKQYFRGELKQFLTPISLMGTPFQKSVWLELKKIPFGETCSYLDIAKRLDNPGAVRAVGSANGSNPLAIVIPCHRVVTSGGQIGGYAGGVARKKWLLEHEAGDGK